ELSTNLFRTVLKDTVQILGEATTLAKIKLWEDYGDNIINVSIIHQYTLMGDPVTDLTLPDKPDLTLGPQDAIFSPVVPAEADSSLSIKIRVHNWGLATPDSIRIEVLDVKADQRVVPIGSTIVLPPLGLVDSLMVNWRIADQAGPHTIRILLDPLNEINEENETNNNQDFPLYIYSSKLTISRPTEFQLVSPQEVTLQVNNPAVTSRAGLPPSFQFELDTTDTFDSPALISSPFISEGKIVTKWQPTSLIDATTYFWRCRTIEEGSDFGQWVTSSFSTQSGLEGHFWRQQHQQQFARNDWKQTQLLSHGVQIQPRPFILRVESAGYHDGNFTRILVNFQPMIEPHRGHNLVAINPHNGQILLARSFDTLLSQDEANALADIIHGLEDGTYVLVGIMDEGSYRMTEAAYQALESIGSKLCRNVGWRDSWAIIGIKGAPVGSVKEQHIPAFQGIAVVQDTLINYYPHGTLTSPPIGPATAWKSLSWTEDLSTPGTDITLDVIGFNKKSALWDTLLTDLTHHNTEDLSSINAQLYPLIKLRAHLTSTDGLHTPFLKDWSVAYEPVPDLAISPQVVSISADTVMEGEPIQLTAEIHNVGLRVADSIRVRFLLSTPDRVRVPFGPDQLLTNIAVDSFKTVTQTWHSKGHRGNIQLFIEIDPEDQITELYEFNNIFSQTIFVKTDTIRPEIQVTFDGKEILPGDLVSSHPRIMATIRDNSPLAIDDTSHVLLLLNGKKVTYLGNEQLLQLLPSSQGDDPGLKARILFTPTLSDGHYSLVIIVSDASGNSIDYQQEFQVISKFKLLQVMNYPNPFASHTSFTYYLTQPADQVAIKIYTLAGRLIRNLNSAPGEVGFNHYAWDGRDEDGDELANGVYLYKIIAKAGEQQDSVIEKLVVMR
ncbi:MAG: T9SS type A sorting domain-containing protein, partial [candidate division KSB1 bacterium]|nr:T9SS type A sorting domain-containing protein [candidate division KSB1 bacterium]